MQCPSDTANVKTYQTWKTSVYPQDLEIKLRILVIHLKTFHGQAECLSPESGKKPHTSDKVYSAP